MKSPNNNRKNGIAHMLNRRATAAIVAGLAGLTLMGAAPVIAHAEDIAVVPTTSITQQVSDVQEVLLTADADAVAAGVQTGDEAAAKSDEVQVAVPEAEPAVTDKGAEQTAGAAEVETAADAKAEAADAKNEAADAKADDGKADATETVADETKADETKAEDTKADADAKAADAAKTDADDAKAAEATDAKAAEAADAKTDADAAKAAETAADAAKTDAKAADAAKAADTNAIVPKADADVAKADASAAKTDIAKTDTTTTKSPAAKSAITWEDYRGGDINGGNKAAAKLIIDGVVGACKKNPMDVLKSIIGLASIDESTQYSTNNVMHLLYDMENQISDVSLKVSNMQESLSKFQTELFSRQDFQMIFGFKDLLTHDDGVVGVLTELANRLGQYAEVGPDGKATDRACSLSSSYDSLPDEARAKVKEAVKNIKYLSNTQVDKDIIGVERFLKNMVCGSEAGNIVADYFNLLNTHYNWDAETFDAKRNFLTELSNMYTNAYIAESLSLTQKFQDLKASNMDTDMITRSMSQLRGRMYDFYDAVFGENGFWNETFAKDDLVKNYVTGNSYRKGTYACVSSYSKDCFQKAFTEGGDEDIQYVASNWDLNSTFSTEEVVAMVARLNALRSAGCAPRKADGSMVYGILEEMEAMGFKNIKTDSYGYGTWNSALSNITGYIDTNSNGLPTKSVTNKFVELGDLSQEKLFGDEDEFHMGTRIANSSDWVITKVTKPRLGAGSQSFTFKGLYTGGGYYKSYCCYGDVVNVKTGQVIQDQLLYAIRNYQTATGTYTAMLQYYAFGTLRLGTEQLDAPSAGEFKRIHTFESRKPDDDQMKIHGKTINPFGTSTEKPLWKKILGWFGL